MTGLGRIILAGKAEVGLERIVEGPAFASLMLWGPRPGGAVTVTDETCSLFRARVVAIEGKGPGTGSATLKLYEAMGPGWRGPEVTLIQALTEKERMELIIQKTTELGVAAIVPFESDKSISLEERDFTQKKSHKWTEVALKAARQSRRDSIPELRPCTDFAGALKEAEGAGARLMLHEGGAPIKEVLRAASDEARGLKGIVVMSGPEGGFTGSEVERAKAAGFTPVSLGPWVLRAETAPIAALAVIGAEFL